MQVDELLATARHLTDAQKSRPRQAFLSRAQSTLYYAMFHALARCCADMLVGSSRSSVSEAAWRQVYRALEHGFARSQCLNRRVMQDFSQPIESFANHFVTMQLKRHAADYDPDYRTSKSEVLRDLRATVEVIGGLSRATVSERRAFAAWVLLRPARTS